MNPLNEQQRAVGLIGCGLRTRAVVRHLLRESEGRVLIAAACDPKPEAIAAFREEFNPRMLACATVEELVALPELEWIIIGSLNSLHAEHAIKALEAGKNVFCEKPLATTVEDCLRVQEVAERTGGAFSLGMVFRYSVYFRKLKEILTSEEVGKVLSFEFNETLDFNHGGHIFGGWRRFRALSGSHMLEKCCHQLDLANWLVSSLPVRVASFGGKDFFLPENAHHMERIGPDAEGRPAYRTWPGEHPYSPFSEGSTVVDNQIAILEFANGVRGTFHANSNAAITERRFYFCCEQATVRADLMTGVIEVKRIGFNTELERFEMGVKGGHGGGDRMLGQTLAASILSGEPPDAGVREGIASCFVAMALNESMDEGRMVDLLPLWKRAGISPLPPLGSEGEKREMEPVL